MEMKDLAQKRLKLVRDAAGFKTKPERIPQNSFFVTWKIFDSGYKLTEAMTDYSIMEKVVREHQEKYNWDMQFEPGTRNAFRITLPLGGGWYTIDDIKEVVAYKDVGIIGDGEMEEYISDPSKFSWEKGMKKKYPAWDENITLETMQKVWDETAAFGAFAMKMNKMMLEEYGLPVLTNAKGGCYPGIDFLFNTLRGMKGFSVDLRRHPALMKEAIAVIDKTYFAPGLEMLRNTPKGADMTCCYDWGITGFCHNFLSMKQWDELYWPYMKAQLDLLDEKELTCLTFMEGSSERFWDYFSEYRKGTVLLRPDKDDVFELRKKLPNVSILGGMRNSLLGRGTKAECLELAKRLIDELGGEGGFIMSQDNLGSYRNDAKAENLKAVCDFTLEYSPA